MRAMLARRGLVPAVLFLCAHLSFPSPRAHANPFPPAVRLATVDLSGIRPLTFASVNGILFFAGCDAAHGCELWRTDGTVAGTVMVADINPGPADSWPGPITNINGILFFSADDGVHGEELWKSDGTTGGTVLVADINPGPAKSMPHYFTDVNGVVFFAALHAAYGLQLWRTDGTAAGTVFLGSSHTALVPHYLTNVNGTLFFRADDGSPAPGTYGEELRKSDGTPEGTVLVADIYPGVYSSFPAELTNVGGTLFFVANDGVHGQTLWRSDGTAAGTFLISAAAVEVAWLTNVDGTLYFLARDAEHGRELWKSDGTTAGTVLVADINPGPGDSAYEPLVGGNGVVFIHADDGVHGRKLWRSDGTPAGTFVVAAPGTAGSGADHMTSVNGTLFFVGYGPGQLWRSDGTASGTTLVADVSPYLGSGPLQFLIGTDAALYFVAGTRGHAFTSTPADLWKVTRPLSLTTDQPNFRVGETLRLNLATENAGDEAVVDVYFGAFLPPGTLACPNDDPIAFLTDGFTGMTLSCASAAPDTFGPLFRALPLAAALPPTTFTDFFTLRWTEDLPAGPYTFFVAVTVPNAFADSVLDAAELLAITALSVNFLP